MASGSLEQLFTISRQSECTSCKNCYSVEGNFLQIDRYMKSVKFEPLEYFLLYLRSVHSVIVCIRFNFRILQSLKFSISPAKGLQPSPLNCSSRVIWVEKSRSGSTKVSKFSSHSAASSPPAKRRKTEESFHDLLDLQGLLMEDREKQSHDGVTLDSEMRMCVVLSTPLPVMQSGCNEHGVTIVATWERSGEDSRSTGPEEVSEVGVASLSHRLLCTGELNLSDSCLNLWNGEKSLVTDQSAQ